MSSLNYITASPAVHTDVTPASTSARIRGFQEPVGAQMSLRVIEAGGGTATWPVEVQGCKMSGVLQQPFPISASVEWVQAMDYSEVSVTVKDSAQWQWR